MYCTCGNVCTLTQAFTQTHHQANFLNFHSYCNQHFPSYLTHLLNTKNRKYCRWEHVDADPAWQAFTDFTLAKKKRTFSNMGGVDEYLWNGYGFFEVPSTKDSEAPRRRAGQIYCQSHLGVRAAHTWETCKRRYNKKLTCHIFFGQGQ